MNQLKLETIKWTGKAW